MQYRPPALSVVPVPVRLRRYSDRHLMLHCAHSQGSNLVLSAPLLHIVPHMGVLLSDFAKDLLPLPAQVMSLPSACPEPGAL